MEITINYKGVEFEVGFDYQPEEKAVMYYSDGSGYPGCAESIEGIYEIKHRGDSFLEFFENDMKAIEDAVWERLHEPVDY